MLLFFIVFLVAALIIEWVSLKNPLKYIEYEMAPAKKLVDPDEEFEIVSTMENARRRPILFIEIQEKMPNQIRITHERHRSRRLKSMIDKHAAKLTVTRTTYLMSRQHLERRVKAVLPSRGRYSFWGASVWSGDFLGLREKHRSFDCPSEIVVKPAPASGAQELLALGGFLGSVSVRRFIMEDPVLKMGFREYTGSEPQKSIAWKRSASLGRLVVNNHDHTLEPSVTVVLNVDCFDEKTDESRIERCYCLARFVCETLEKQRISYGFITNAATAGALGRWKYIAEGLGISHLSTILEGLGRATHAKAERFAHTIDRAVHMAERGRSHIVITPFETPALKEGAARLRGIVGGETLVISPEERG